MNKDTKAKIIVAAAFDAAKAARHFSIELQPSINLASDEEKDLYKCCLLAIKNYARELIAIQS